MKALPWILGGAGVIAVVALGSRKAKAAPPPLPPPGPRPPPGPAPAPIPRPPPDERPPAGAVRTATISAPRGANVRAFPPSTNARILAKLPQGSRVGIMEEGPPLPPTAGMQGGWQKIRTSRGVDGYVAIADAEGVRILHFDDEPPEEVFTAGWSYDAVGEHGFREHGFRRRWHPLVRPRTDTRTPEQVAASRTSAAILQRLRQYEARGASPKLIASMQRRYEEALDAEHEAARIAKDVAEGRGVHLYGTVRAPYTPDPYRYEESLYRGYAPMRF